ncbi:MAG: hydroxymethylbilane synthase [Actinobacteria bacterium]|nr:hydroxymethylbilane synthase [Actinomycetota bacterium]
MRIGTRGSALALAQAGMVARRLGPDAELVTVTTSGDASDARIRRDVNDKERWVRELELGLLAGELDLAVHSAKDVPSVLPEGLELVGAPPRGDPFDALVGAPSLPELAPGARVGTASLRRAAQLLALREDLQIVVVRGNVDTRLRKLHDGDVDALVLAAAGLVRLGREDEIGCVLHELVPAPGQGTLTLEARVGDESAVAAARAITDERAWEALRAERALVRRLDASCNTPLGAYATVGAGGIVLRTFAGLPDGSSWLRDETPPAATADAAGALAAERMLAAGAGELLARAEQLAAR